MGRLTAHRLRSSRIGMPAMLLVFQADPAPHEAQFVSVDEGVHLEVLSFGGTGRPIVLLAGMGNTAHVFDRLGPRLTALGSVYAITRRGFGVSSHAPDGYDVGRLGEDVLAVITTMGLNGPVVVGHSIAGQELSYLAAEHPDRIAGLVYLDAGYWYAFDPSGDMERDLPAPPPTERPLPEMAIMPAGERLQALRVDVGWRAGGAQTVAQAVDAGGRQFTEIDVPVLAIFASHVGAGDPAWDRYAGTFLERFAGAFERGVPRARVLRWARTSHHLFLTREADVVREVGSFLSTLR